MRACPARRPRGPRSTGCWPTRRRDGSTSWRCGSWTASGGRSPHLLQVLDQLAANGVGFAAIRDAGIDTTTPTGRLLLQLLGAFADYERSLLRERVVAGVRRAQASGKHCGRPRKELDLRPALALLNEGRGLKDVARILKVPRATLRRRLDEAGRWPVGRQAA